MHHFTLNLSYQTLKLSLLTLLFFFTLTATTQAAFTATDFITTWDTENTGTSASNQITIPGTGAGYSYSIYWESLSSSTATGTIATSTSASQTITFPEPGEYKVAIKGTYPRIYFNNGGDKLKILTVEQWGNIAWTSMENAFYGCANLTVPATDAPDLSGVTSIRAMFASTASFNDSIDHWNVSNINDMSSLFYYASSFNQPLNSWNTANVTNMTNLFLFASSFNQPLNSWNTANVTSMLNTFNNASSFNQPLNSWDVSKVTTLQAMFSHALSFNQPLDQWNTASNTDMINMFWATPFNQDISMWNTSNVQGIGQMFIENIVFNQPLNSWDVSKVTNMIGVFNGSESFNQSLASWNIASATDMTSMFLNTSLSQSNMDSTLQGWAAQSLNSNVPFHLGLKTYSSTGQTALDTLRDTYNWTITEQYQAEYQEGDGYTLSGTTTQSPINLNGTTTAVEVIPNNRCTFLSWSDGNTNNPRTDTLTDNLTVSATVECHNPTTSTSAKGRANKLEALGNQDKAEAIRQEYNLTPNSSLHTAITTLLTLTTNPSVTNNPQTKQQLITLLIKLVEVLEGMRGG